MSEFLSGDLLSSFAGVAVDAVVGRLARSDKSVSTYAELKAAVEAVLPTQKAIIKVTKNITWPNYMAGANDDPYTIRVKAGADVTIFGAVGVFQRQKAKFTGLGNAASMGQTRSAFVVEGEYRAVTDVDTSNPGKNVFKGSLTLKNILAEDFVIKSGTTSTLATDKNFTNPGTPNADMQPMTVGDDPGFFGAFILALSGANVTCQDCTFAENFIFVPYASSVVPTQQISGHGAAIAFLGNANALPSNANTSTSGVQITAAPAVGPQPYALVPSVGCFSCCTFEENFVLAMIPPPTGSELTTTNFFDANNTTDTSRIKLSGGAVYALSYRKLSFRESIFKGNGLQGIQDYGVDITAAIATAAEGTLTSVVINAYRNIVCSGGAVDLSAPYGTYYYNQNGSTSQNDFTTLTNNGIALFHDCIFEDNASSYTPLQIVQGLGGGVNNAGDIVLTGDIGAGGAIAIDSEEPFKCPTGQTCGTATKPRLELSNSVFARNLANFGGSAIIVARTFADINIVSTTFCNNTAGGLGGLVATNLAGDPTLANTTGGGGAVYLDFSFPGNTLQPEGTATTASEAAVNASPSPLTLSNSQFRGNISLPSIIPLSGRQIATSQNNVNPAIAVATLGTSTALSTALFGSTGSLSMVFRAWTGVAPCSVPRIIVDCTKFYGNYASTGAYPSNTFDGREVTRIYAQNCPANALTARKACVVNALLGATEWQLDQANPSHPNARALYNLGVYGGGFTDVVCSLDCTSNGRGNPGITEWCVPARSKTYTSGCYC